MAIARPVPLRAARSASPGLEAATQAADNALVGEIARAAPVPTPALPDREPERDPARPTQAQAGPVSPLHLLAIQRAAGNRAATELLARRAGAATAAAPVVQRQPEVDAALQSKDPGDVKSIPPAVFRNVSIEDRMALIRILAYQGWVGLRDETQIEIIWASIPPERLPAVASREILLWNHCKSVGASLDGIGPVTTLKGWFTDDVKALARKYLAENRTLVTGEMGRAGIPEGAAEPIPPATADQQKNLDGMRSAAASVGKLQEQQEIARETLVGYSLRPYLLEARPYWTAVPFDPFRPPERPDAPDYDPDDPSPMKQKSPVLRKVPVQPYAPILKAYDEANASIRKLVTVYPMLYAISRDASSATTLAFADKTDPAAARAQLAGALRKLLGDIDGAGAKLGNQLNPLDLLPLHQQLMDGQAFANRKVDWSLQWPKGLAQELVEGHQTDEALKALGLQLVSEMAFMLGSAAQGPGMLALLAVGLAAAGVKAKLSNEKYQALQQASKTAVAKDTDLVNPAQVDVAKAQAEADMTAAVLASLNMAAAVAGAIGGAAAAKMKAGSTRAKPAKAGGPPPGGGGSGPGRRGLREVLGAEEYDRRLGECSSRRPAAQAAGVTDDELIALDAWSHNDSKEINNHLRGAGSSERAALLADGARTGAAKMPAYSGPAKRIQTVVPEGGFQQGGEYVSEGFMATTRGKATPKGISGNVIMEVNATGKSGRDVSPLMRHPEGEVLYPPGTRFRITKAVKVGNAWIVGLEEL